MNAQVIIEKLVANNGRYIDDHVHYGDPVRTCSGYVVVNKDGEDKVCPLYKEYEGFCLNPLYVDNGEIHLSKISIDTCRIEYGVPTSYYPIKDVVWFDQAA